MTGENYHDYIFRLTDKAIFEALYYVGTMRDCSTLTLSEVIKSCKISQTISVIEFFERAGILHENKTLSDLGKELFELFFVFSNKNASNELIKQILLKNPVVSLICQYFYGKGKIGIEQLRTLLNYHSIGSKEIVHVDVVSLLTLLNKYNIVVYDKKNMSFIVKVIENSVEPISQYYITPDMPYTNIYNMRKVIRSCRGDIYWIDKHFRKDGFELLVDGIPFDGVNSITIISGIDNLTASAKEDYQFLQLELSQRGISLNWRIICDKSFKWHDRWLVADNQCHNIPPILAIIRGQRAEILLTKEHLDVQPFISNSVPVS